MGDKRLSNRGGEGFLITGQTAPLFQQTSYWLPIMLAGSAVFGIFVGLNASFEATRWLLSKVGVYVPHAITSLNLTMPCERGQLGNVGKVAPTWRSKFKNGAPKTEH